jgi:predicted transcriptional regulator
MNITEMKAKLGIVKVNYANFKEVKIIGRDQEYAIIDNIEEQNTNNIGLYSQFIVNPENIKEGQMISK